MKNIFKISKRGTIAILALCILFGIVGTCLNVAAIEEDTTAATDETTAVAAEKIIALSTEEATVSADETTQELVPMIARGCDGNEYSTRTWDSLDAAKKHYGNDWEYKSCNYTHTNGVTYNYYYTMSSGARVYIRVL